MREITTIDARAYINNNFKIITTIPADDAVFDLNQEPNFRRFIITLDSKYSDTDDSYYISDQLQSIGFKTKEVLETVRKYLKEKEQIVLEFSRQHIKYQYPDYDLGSDDDIFPSKSGHQLRLEWCERLFPNAFIDTIIDDSFAVYRSMLPIFKQYYNKNKSDLKELKHYISNPNETFKEFINKYDNHHLDFARHYIQNKFGYKLTTDDEIFDPKKYPNLSNNEDEFIQRCIEYLSSRIKNYCTNKQLDKLDEDNITDLTSSLDDIFDNSDEDKDLIINLVNYLPEKLDQSLIYSIKKYLKKHYGIGIGINEMLLSRTEYLTSKIEKINNRVYGRRECQFKNKKFIHAINQITTKEFLTKFIRHVFNIYHKMDVALIDTLKTNFEYDMSVEYDSTKNKKLSKLVSEYDHIFINGQFKIDYFIDYLTIKDQAKYIFTLVYIKQLCDIELNFDYQLSSFEENDKYNKLENYFNIHDERLTRLRNKDVLCNYIKFLNLRPETNLQLFDYINLSSKLHLFYIYRKINYNNQDFNFVRYCDYIPEKNYWISSEKNYWLNCNSHNSNYLVIDFNSHDTYQVIDLINQGGISFDKYFCELIKFLEKLETNDINDTIDNEYFELFNKDTSVLSLNYFLNEHEKIIRFKYFTHKPAVEYNQYKPKISNYLCTSFINKPIRWFLLIIIVFLGAIYWHYNNGFWVWFYNVIFVFIILGIVVSCFDWLQKKYSDCKKTIIQQKIHNLRVKAQNIKQIERPVMGANEDNFGMQVIAINIFHQYIKNKFDINVNQIYILDASFGMGKTSVLNMLKLLAEGECFDYYNKDIHISNNIDVVQISVLQFFAYINQTADNSTQTIISNILNYINTQLCNAQHDLMSSIINTFDNADIQLGTIKLAFKNWKKDSAFCPHSSRQFKDKIITSKQQTLLIFEDIDRLNDKQLVILGQILVLIYDIPQIITILPLQKDKLIEAIDKEHKSEYDTNYIEPLSKKIIQQIIPYNKYIYRDMADKIVNKFWDTICINNSSVPLVTKHNNNFIKDEFYRNFVRDDVLNIISQLKISMREFKYVINSFEEIIKNNVEIKNKISIYHNYVLYHNRSYETNIIWLFFRIFLLLILKYRDNKNILSIQQIEQNILELLETPNKEKKVDNIDNIPKIQEVLEIFNNYPLKYKTIEGQLLQYIIDLYINKICHYTNAVVKPSHIQIYELQLVNLIKKNKNSNIFDEDVKDKFWQKIGIYPHVILSIDKIKDFRFKLHKFIATDILFPQIFGRENQLLCHLPEIFDLFKKYELGNGQSSKTKFNCIHKNLGYFILKIIAYKLSNDEVSINTIRTIKDHIKLIQTVLEKIVIYYKDNISTKHHDYLLYWEGSYIICCLLYMRVITKLGMSKEQFVNYINHKYLKTSANDIVKSNRIKQLIDYNFDNMVNHFIRGDSLNFKIDEDLP
jgi:hypothetical protein